MSRPIGVIFVLLISGSAMGQASFQGLGDLPGGSFDSVPRGVSADGLVVVGDGHSSLGGEAFRWQDGAMTGLSDLPGGFFSSEAVAASADGSVIVGSGSIPGNEAEAFRWEDGVMMRLGQLPEGVGSSRAEGISWDGSVIVGYGTNSNDRTEAFRWEDGVMTGLGDLPGANVSSFAFAVSSDGSVVVGKCSGEVCRWEDGVPTGLGFLPGGGGWAYATGVSGDGSVVVGASSSTLGHQAFRWEDGVMVGLGSLGRGSSSQCDTTAYGVSGDGMIVVGYDAANGFEDDAFIWDEINGMRSLRDVLVAYYKLDLTGWTLERAHGVSADGLTIVGYGTNPNGDTEAWIVRLPVAPTITWSDPPSGVIDARQDYSLSGSTPMGIDRIRVRFSMLVRDASTHGPLDETSFEVRHTAGDPPVILEVNRIDEPVNTYEVVLQDPITPGAWTTLIPHVERIDGASVPDAHVAIGFLPADASGDGVSAPIDIIRLIDHLNGVYDPPMTIEQCDINRSGVCGPADILRLIDLLNGVNTSREWLGATLPPRP